MDWPTYRIEVMGNEAKNILPPDIKLPALPKAVMEFSRKAEDPNSTNNALGAIIESDAGLTADLLKYVNSSAVGVRRQISSAKQAISLLGIKTTKLYVLTAATNNLMKSCQSKLINFQVFWNTNYERAVFARELAKLIQADADVAFAGAMLQDFVLPIVTNERLDEYIDYTTEEKNETVELTAYEDAKLGWNHALAAAHLMVAWGFPDELICCVLQHHSGLKILADANLRQTSVAAVALSSLMPDPLHQVPSGLNQLVALDKSWPQFDLLQTAQCVQEVLDEEAPIRASNHISFLHRVEKVCMSAETAE